jgi:16S rRNA (cytosine967-C5)-methyltransferase
MYNSSMAGPKNETARSIAAQVLNQCDPKRDYAGPILDKLLHKTDQRQRATDLVFGSLRNRRAIDAIIATFSGRPIERIQGRLLNIIRVGTYELAYCPAAEEYAIVNEAVENTKTTAGVRPVPVKTGKQGDFVNAVLRQITRHITNRQVQLSQADARCTLVQTPSTGCEFDASFLPDSRSNSADYLSIVFSLPKWLVSSWLAEFGEESARQICLASNRRPSVYIRPNTLKTTAQGLAEKLNKENIDSELVDGTLIKLVSPRAVTQLPGFEEGLFIVQDVAASQPVELLDPQPHWTILDLCAAPGVKTTQLAEATGDSATIIATDIDVERLKKVEQNVTRLGIKSVEIVPYEEVLNSKFDCVLLDVPCSNTGVLAKRVEARHRVNPRAIQELARIQAGLLRTAAKMVKPHGNICYSTCSIQDEENGRLVEDFLRENDSFELEAERLTLPSAAFPDHDGGYTAILVSGAAPAWRET